MKEEIQRRLQALEKEEGVRVLFAVESGSRAWGFESPNSDWDVRFVYIRPKGYYLDIDIESKKDTIESIEGDIDLSGWDLPKALRLFRKSNPPLLEWIRSPLVYRPGRLRSLLADMTEFFSPRACIYHYLHMAEGNYKEYLKRDEVRLKKYFYVLRPLLACEWIEAHGEPPPMLFEDLLRNRRRDPELLADVEDLLAIKRSGTEMGMAPQRPRINRFLEERIAHFQEGAKTAPVSTGWSSETLNAIFRDFLE